MVLIKATEIPPDEADIPFIAEFTYAANKERLAGKGLSIEKIKKILEKHFQQKVFSYILTCEDGDLGGWLLLYEENVEKLVINPGETLGGYPIINPDAQEPKTILNTLLSHAIKIVKDSKFKKIEFILPLSEQTTPFTEYIESSGFFLNLTYTDMECDLSKIPSPPVTLDYKTKPVNTFSENDRLLCYNEAFTEGDSTLFKFQSESEKTEFYEELYQEDYADEELSVGILKDDKLIGFSYVLEFEPGYKHISCMCILPEYQKKGVGSFLMDYIIRKAQDSGTKMITLGTEPEMAAYRLYKKHGFQDVASFNIYRWDKEAS